MHSIRYTVFGWIQGVRNSCVFSGNWRMNISGDLDKTSLFTNNGASLKTEEVSIPFLDLFLKKDSLCFNMVCHIGGSWGRKW